MNSVESKQLDLLSMFHYIVGGFTALFSCIPFLHVFMGLAIISGKMFKNSHGAEQPPNVFGWLFVIMGSVCILLGWMTAVCILIAGKKLKARKWWLFCMVIAGIECMFMPFGTVLGIFTLVTLNKESVKKAFVPLDAEQIPKSAE